jgi:hypothetical protein
VEYWKHGSESRNNYAFGHEYSKGSFQVSAALGIFDGKGEINKKTNQTELPCFDHALSLDSSMPVR